MSSRSRISSFFDVPGHRQLGFAFRTFNQELETSSNVKESHPMTTLEQTSWHL